MPPYEPNPADSPRDAANPAAPGTGPSPPIASDIQTRRPATVHWPLAAAGLFMLVGIMALLYIGRTPPPILNAPMPDTELIGLLNSDAELSDAEVAGRVVVYHFWGTWCPPCRAEYPDFAAMTGSYSGSKDVRIVSVSCSPGEETDLEKLREQTRGYLQELGVAAMPVYCDPTAYTRIQILRLMGTSGFAYPTTILVDKRGIVREFHSGMTDMEDLKDQIEELREAK